ncbi:MAG: carboxymuconolactone decarboxylase family protein [Spirochaetia bacterium]
MNDTRNPMEVFREEAPAAAQAFNGLITALSASQDLDGRTRQLIYIAMKAAQGDVGAVAAHAGMAKKAGASRAELREAILMTLTVSGIRGVVTCLAPALSAWEVA